MSKNTQILNKYFCLQLLNFSILFKLFKNNKNKIPMAKCAMYLALQYKIILYEI